VAMDHNLRVKALREKREEGEFEIAEARIAEVVGSRRSMGGHALLDRGLWINHFGRNRAWRG